MAKRNTDELIAGAEKMQKKYADYLIKLKARKTQENYDALITDYKVLQQKYNKIVNTICKYYNNDNIDIIIAKMQQ